MQFTLAFGPADGMDIATTCPNTCLRNRFPLSGIAEGIFCFCSDNGECFVFASCNCTIVCEIYSIIIITRHCIIHS
ncbi:hypothetical protein E2C01_068796 [Portunus trituberculatus]|uniref:Uncharacterized protein n=1 Tax=Portunus trituberculatus TaxID=210409 RepID=A0A5B7HYU8_PORTR|nr:hypothetical protein [Portunus trituberculatus]